MMQSDSDSLARLNGRVRGEPRETGGEEQWRPEVVNASSVLKEQMHWNEF